MEKHLTDLEHLSPKTVESNLSQTSGLPGQRPGKPLVIRKGMIHKIRLHAGDTASRSAVSPAHCARGSCRQCSTFTCLLWSAHVWHILIVHRSIYATVHEWNEQWPSVVASHRASLSVVHPVKLYCFCWQVCNILTVTAWKSNSWESKVYDLVIAILVKCCNCHTTMMLIP